MVRTAQLRTLALAAGMVVSACSGSTGSTSIKPASLRPSISPAPLTWSTGPAATLGEGVQWLHIMGAGGNPASRQGGDVLFPSGTGPHPVVVYLHGSGGLTRDDLYLARPFAQAGYITVVECWRQLPHCEQTVGGDEASVDAIIQVARGLPGARTDRVAVVGVSLGGWEVFQLLARRHDLTAAIADSAESTVDPNLIDTPILILDPASDLGVTNSHQTELGLRAAGKPVEAHYFPGAYHVVISNRPEAVMTAIDFLHRHLDD